MLIYIRMASAADAEASAARQRARRVSTCASSITPRRCRLSEARPSEARDINALFAASALTDVCCLYVSLAVLTLAAAWQQTWRFIGRAAQLC